MASPYLRANDPSFFAPLLVLRPEISYFLFLAFSVRTLALAAAASCAISFRLLGESVLARCFPPWLPSARAISERFLFAIHFSLALGYLFFQENSLNELVS